MLIMFMLLTMGCTTTEEKKQACAAEHGTWVFNKYSTWQQCYEDFRHFKTVCRPGGYTRQRAGCLPRKEAQSRANTESLKNANLGCMLSQDKSAEECR